MFRVRMGVSDPISDELAARFRAGDLAAFDAVFSYYHPRLCAFVDRTYVGSSEDAKDIVQNVFVRVWRAPKRLPADRPLGACLYEIARGEALNFVSRRRRRARLFDRHAAETRTAESGERKIHARLYLSDVLRAIAELPRRRREAFLLRRQEGLSYREIGERLGISARTAEHYVEAGHERMLRAVGADRE